MHGFVKKGVLVSLAAGSLLLGAAGAAAADSATASGQSAGSEGLGSGNVAQGAADVPVQVCGDTVAAAAHAAAATANSCQAESNTAAVGAATSNDAGVVSGDIVGAAVNTLMQGCGLTAAALSSGSGTAADTCDAKQTPTAATASTANDAGVGTGDVVQVAGNVPVQVCGDAVSVAGADSGATANSCSNG